MWALPAELGPATVIQLYRGVEGTVTSAVAQQLCFGGCINVKAGHALFQWILPLISV